MKIIRYSKTGFEARDQDFHMNRHVYYHLFNFNLETYPENKRGEILENHRKLVRLYKENFMDFKRGIWIFIDGFKNDHSLNHLKEKVPCFEADIDNSVDAYSVNWEYKLKLSDDIVKLFGCYIPEREISKISNIKRRCDE